MNKEIIISRLRYKLHVICVIYQFMAKGNLLSIFQNKSETVAPTDMLSIANQVGEQYILITIRRVLLEWCIWEKLKLFIEILHFVSCTCFKRYNSLYSSDL